MEGVEFAAAEFNFTCRDLKHSTPSQILGQASGRFTYLDLCPKSGVFIDRDEEIKCVESLDIVSGKKFDLPAELIFSPLISGTSVPHFGSSTNGLASGMTDEEAITHAILELLERDTTSFETLFPESKTVCINDISGPVGQAVNKIRSAGFELFIKYRPSVIGIPYFHAVLVSPDPFEAVGMAYGFGCHLRKEVALSRAITEAAQSRLSHIHGGRDDIIKRRDYFRAKGWKVERAAIQKALSSHRTSESVVRFDSIKSFDDIDVNSMLSFLMVQLYDRSFKNVLTVKLSGDDFPVSVWRVVIPKLEFFEVELRRLGSRLGARVSDA